MKISKYQSFVNYAVILACSYIPLAICYDLNPRLWSENVKFIFLFIALVIGGFGILAPHIKEK